MRATRFPGRLMDLRTAAAYLGCSYWTLRDLVLKGYIPAVRIPSPRARDGRALRRTLIDSRDLELLIERWKEGNTIVSTDCKQRGGRNGNALQTRRSVVDQVLPERARPARIVAQHEGRRGQASAQIAGGRYRARPTGRSKAESNPVRGSGGGPEDGVRRERPPFGRRARAADFRLHLMTHFGGRRLAAIATTDINRFILTRQADVMVASDGRSQRAEVLERRDQPRADHP